MKKLSKKWYVQIPNDPLRKYKLELVAYTKAYTLGYE